MITAKEILQSKDWNIINVKEYRTTYLLEAESKFSKGKFSRYVSKKYFEKICNETLNKKPNEILKK
jgi:hypothetical protein